MAERTRVETPNFSRASWSARLLMTVASIPIVSALARSIPISLAIAPRKILPPPMTKASSQPSSFTSLISCANAFTVLPSMPKSRGPANTSPVTLRMMRLYLGVPLFMKDLTRVLLFHSCLAEMITSKPSDLDILAKTPDRIIDHISHFFIRIFNKRLLEQTDFGVKAFHFTLDDFVDHLFRLSRFQGLLAVDHLFLFDLRSRYFLAPHVTRIRRCDLHRDILKQRLELRRARNKVSLAIDFHQHADFTAGMHIGGNGAVRGYAVRFFCGGGQAFLPQIIDRLMYVSAGLPKRFLAIHHSRPGFFPEF